MGRIACLICRCVCVYFYIVESTDVACCQEDVDVDVDGWVGPPFSLNF